MRTITTIRFLTLLITLTGCSSQQIAADNNVRRVPIPPRKYKLPESKPLTINERAEDFDRRYNEVKVRLERVDLELTRTIRAIRVDIDKMNRGEIEIVSSKDDPRFARLDELMRERKQLAKEYDRLDAEGAKILEDLQRRRNGL